MRMAVATVVLLAACTPSEDPAVRPTATLPTAAWRALAPIPTPRTEVAAALAGGRIHVAGGFDADGATVPTVEAYDIAADRWEPVDPLPTAVNHAMAAGDGDVVYVLGGYTSEGDPTDRGFALRGGAWEELPPMPEARAAGGAAVVDDVLYVVAGVGPDGHADRTLVLDLPTERWSTAAGVRVRRDHLGVAAAGGLVYAIGGREGDLTRNVGAAEAYDPASGSWRTLPDLPTPRGGMAATATDDGSIVALGGEEEGGTFDEAEVFDPDAERWFALPPMPSPRHGLGAAADGSRVYAIAGGPRPGLSVSDTVEVIDLAA